MELQDIFLNNFIQMINCDSENEGIVFSTYRHELRGCLAHISGVVDMINHCSDQYDNEIAPIKKEIMDIDGNLKNLVQLLSGVNMGKSIEDFVSIHLRELKI